MARKPSKEPRKQKLKVFRTPIGFHDAFVAAPSQKAALEAWGADSNLFAQGIAEQVDDPKLMAEPLANPGKVLKLIRGSADEHFAELDRAPVRKRAAKPVTESGKVTEGKPRTRPKPKPSRDALDAAEQALEKADKRHRKALREIDEQIEGLQRERRKLQRRHEAEHGTLTEKRDQARSAYERAMRQWKAG